MVRMLVASEQQVDPLRNDQLAEKRNHRSRSCCLRKRGQRSRGGRAVARERGVRGSANVKRPRLEPLTTRSALGLWAFAARNPALYRAMSAVGLRVMRLFARRGWIEQMPLAGGWTI